MYLSSVSPVPVVLLLMSVVAAGALLVSAHGHHPPIDDRDSKAAGVQPPKRSSNTYAMPDSVLRGFSLAATRGLQREYVEAYAIAKAAKEAVEAQVEPCKKAISEVEEEIGSRCIPCVQRYCTDRAFQCYISELPSPAAPAVAAASCEELYSAAADDAEAVGAMCAAHYLRECYTDGDDSINATTTCAADRCRELINTCDPCNTESGTYNLMLCDVTQSGVRSTTLFTDTLPSFFTDDVRQLFTGTDDDRFFTEDVQEFFQDDVKELVTADVPNFFSRDIELFFADSVGEGFLSFVEDAREFFDGAFSSTQDLVTPAFDVFGEGFDAMEGFGDDLEDIFFDIGEYFLDLGEDVSDWFTDVGGDIVGGIRGLFGGDGGGPRRRRHSHLTGGGEEEEAQEARCELIESGESRAAECVAAYRGADRCADGCRAVSDTGVHLPIVCPELSRKNITFQRELEYHSWILAIPAEHIQMTFTSMVVDREDRDPVAGDLYGAVVTAEVGHTRFTFVTQCGVTPHAFTDQLPNIVVDAIDAFRLTLITRDDDVDAHYDAPY